jgi:two-component system nitrogen regulation response regulator NtrX
MKMPGRILIIDDEPNIRRTMEMIHKGAGWETDSAESGEAGLAKIRAGEYDLVYLDLSMPGMGGIEALREIRLLRPNLPVVILTGQGTIERAVEATKLGAFDFLEKEVGRDRILLTSAHAWELGALERENEQLRSRMQGDRRLLGASADIAGVFERIARVAPTEARVLILGESGTGKELVAREIHRRSKRSAKPFVKVNCAAIPEELIEAELFGSVKGAYTGSVRSREGKFRAADGGTIFLDEVGDMSLRVQTKVLRVLQEGEIETVGSDQVVEVDVRVIAATNKDLRAEVAAGRFREDLFFRLNVVPIEVPPLRSHPEDVPLLARSFVAEYCAENGLPAKKLDLRVVEILAAYPWPGNVRELRNQIERMVIMSSGRTITISDVSEEIRRGRKAEPATGPAAADNAEDSERTLTEIPCIGFEGLSLLDAKRRLEATLIVEALERNGWNVTRAAEELGLERTNLHKKIRAYGIAKDEE